MKKYAKPNTPIAAMAKEESRGVFWVIDGDLWAFPFTEEYKGGVADSGATYNHKRLWPNVKPRGCNQPFNYYPRGRVDFNAKGKPIIYLNPNIDESIISEIRTAFGLRSQHILRYDNSEHYKCYLDDGWKPER